MKNYFEKNSAAVENLYGTSIFDAVGSSISKIGAERFKNLTDFVSFDPPFTLGLLGTTAVGVGMIALDNLTFKNGSWAPFGAFVTIFSAGSYLVNYKNYSDFMNDQKVQQKKHQFEDEIMFRRFKL